MFNKRFLKLYFIIYQILLFSNYKLSFFIKILAFFHLIFRSFGIMPKTLILKAEFSLKIPSFIVKTSD
jgi:hypothetical protein